jgi:hypothetical protein
MAKLRDQLSSSALAVLGRAALFSVCIKGSSNSRPARSDYTRFLIALAARNYSGRAVIALPQFFSSIRALNSPISFLNRM